MADDPERKLNEGPGPTRQITRMSAQQNRLEKTTAVGSDYKSAKLSDVNSDLQPNMDSRPTDSGNGILGKGKISFSFRKKLFNPSLVQYSDEDSATSEKEDGTDGKDQLNAKTGQSLLKSANLPPTTPKMTKEHPAFAEDLSEIPIPPDSDSCTHPTDSVSTKNKSPARIHEPTSIEQKYNTQYTTKLLATKTRLEEKLKEIEQRGKKNKRNETESPNSNMLFQQTVSQAVSVERMASLKNDSLMLYEETDNVEIKHTFVQNLSQSSDVTNDLNLCNIDGKNAKLNQGAKAVSETNNLESCLDVSMKSESELGLSHAKQDSKNSHADVCNVKKKLHRSPVSLPKIDSNKDDLSENRRQRVNSECADADTKWTNAGSQLENQSQNGNARVGKLKHKQSETRSDIKHTEDSSLSSSSSSESEDDESSSSSTSSSSSSSSNSSDSEEDDAKMSDWKSVEKSDHDSADHKVLDTSGLVSKTVLRKPEKAQLVDPSRQTTDAVPAQSVGISSELFSPYSPSKPTDEDADIDQTVCYDANPHTTRQDACSYVERCSIQDVNTKNASVSSTECLDSEKIDNSLSDWDKDTEKDWSKEDHAERALAHFANQSSSFPKNRTSAHLASTFISDTKHNVHESSLQYKNSNVSATATSCIHDNEERMTSPDLHVSSEKVMEHPSYTTCQEQHHYIIPPNAPSWNLVEITSNSSSKQHERSHHTKTADGSCKLAYNHNSGLDSQSKYQTCLTSPEKHECVDERDRSHREREHSRSHDWSHDRHRDYGRSRYHRTRDDERDAKTGWDRERDRRHDERFQRYRRSKSRDWDGKSRDRKSRSKERDRVSRSKEWDRRSRSKERDRHSRSRERDRRSKSRERDHYPRSKDQIKRSHSIERDHPSRPRDRDRRSGSRDRRRQSRSRETIRRSRSRDRERRSRSRERETWSRSRRDRRSRSRERRKSRDRYDRDYRRRSRRSPSCEHSDRHRLDEKRERHSSCHYRDEARSQRDHDRELRRTASTVVSTELENIPLPPAGYNLGEPQSYLPADSVPIPTISQSYVPPPPPPCFEEPLRPAIPERVPPTTPSQCQQRNLIYPPTVEMDNVSDIESVDMDVANSPDEAKTAEPGTRTSDVHSIPVISKRAAKDEKPTARVAFMMKTVPKKSAIYRQVLEVLDDDGGSKPSMSQLLQQDGNMTTAATHEQAAENNQEPGYHISEPKSSGHSTECHQSVMAHTSSDDNATVGMIPLPGHIRTTPESTQQVSDIPVPDSVNKGVFRSSSMQETLLNESVSTVTSSAALSLDVQSTSQPASANESIHEDNSEDKSEGEIQSAISAADDKSESETPLTRRRSLRLKSLEEKKEVKKDDVQETNRKKKRGRNDKGPEDTTEASCQSAENQPAASTNQSDGMSTSTPKSHFISPDARDVKPDDLGTPSLKPEKVKSRWRRWSELEASSTDGAPPPPPPPPQSSSEEPTESAPALMDNNDTSSEDGVPPPPPPQAAPTSAKDETKKEEDTSVPSEQDEIPKPPEFEMISEHVYVSDRKRSKCRKEARRMVCDCVLPTKEEYLAGHKPCGDECLNRMLFIECGSRCPCSEFCTNKRFQKHKYAKVETFFAGAKGWGLKTKHKIDPGAFIMEYVGEVLDYREFRRRSKQYSRSNMKHFYFMALNADEVIDATQKGNVSRFINHSCDPNCETQKWTVNGQLRIGFFAIRPVEPGEELTFDYQFESYGQAQKCYCGSDNCRGYIGTTKKSPLKELTNKPTRKEKKKVFDDVLLEEEINDMMELEGMKKRSHVLELARLMVRAVSQEHRLALLKIIQDTKEPACLRLFLDYHGLSLLWSWMVDAAEGSTELKISILNVLKQLPVTNKTVLKESNVMSIVERWAAQVNETKKEETKDEASESSSSGRGTPIVSGKDSSQSTPTTPSYEGLPHKKRKLFQQLQQHEEASSSDGDTASESGKKEATSTKDDTDSQMGDPDSKESESEIDAAQMENEKRNGDWTSPLESDKPMPLVSDIASELISAWGSLKEVYKIPKICAEERKKTEQELDQRYGLDRHDVVGSDREHKGLAGAADWSVNRDGKRRRLSSGRDDETKGTKSKKVLLPTPPEASLSKQKRRAMFEAQVKAQDEFVYQQQIQQQLGQYPQGYQYDPNSPYPDPALTQYPVQPGVAGYASTPNVPIYPSEGSIGSFSDPNVPYSGTQDSTYVDSSVPGQVPAINTTVQTQMIVQPDGTYITAPQPVSTTFQQPAIASTVPDSNVPPAQFVDPNQTTESSIQPAVTGQSPATGQFVEQTPTPVVYQTPAQTQYQAPVATPFISQPVTATVGATPSTVSYVVTPSQQAAPQYVQTQPVQQVYYTTPQGQVIVQQQPVVFQGQTQVVTVAEAAQGPRDPREPPPPPPSPPPKAKKRRLPPNWKTARDSEGKIYYYHTVTRQTQWDPPAWEEGQEDDMDLGTPTHDEPKTKKKTTTAAADTSTETAKRIKDHFRAKMSKLIVSYLNPYRRPDCKAGRITSTDDFKHLARKLTHTVLEKELKHCHHLEDLEVNENVKAKTKDYIKKYMSRFGPVYKKATTSP